MMAFEGLEPFGSLPEDFRIGQVAAVIANVNRDTERKSAPFTAADFMPALRAAYQPVESRAMLLDDPEAQSALFDTIIFGRGVE